MEKNDEYEERKKKNNHKNMKKMTTIKQNQTKKRIELKTKQKQLSSPN